MGAIANYFWNCANSLQEAVFEPPPRHALQLRVVEDHATLPNDWNCSICQNSKEDAGAHLPGDPATWVFQHASSAEGVMHYECRPCAINWAEHRGTWSCVQQCGATGVTQAALEALRPGAVPALPPTWGERIVQTFPEFTRRTFPEHIIGISLFFSSIIAAAGYAVLFSAPILKPLSLFSFSLVTLPASLSGALLGIATTCVLPEAAAWILDTATGALRCKPFVRTAIRKIALIALTYFAMAALTPFLAEKVGLPLILQARESLALKSLAGLVSFFSSFEIAGMGAGFLKLIHAWDNRELSRPIG